MIKDGKLTIELKKPFLSIKEGLNNKKVAKGIFEPAILGLNNNKNSHFKAVSEFVSGKPDSNRRPSAWQADALAN